MRSALCGIAEEPGFDENRRDVGVADDEEAAAADMAIRQAGNLEEPAMDGGGQARALRGVVVGLHAVGLGARRSVEVDADENGVLLGIGGVATLSQADKIVAIAREHDMEAGGAQDFGEAQTHIEGVGLFGHPLAGRPAPIMAAVAGIDDDGIDGRGRHRPKTKCETENEE